MDEVSGRDKAETYVISNSDHFRKALARLRDLESSSETASLTVEFHALELAVSQYVSLSEGKFRNVLENEPNER